MIYCAPSPLNAAAQQFFQAFRSNSRSVAKAPVLVTFNARDHPSGPIRTVQHTTAAKWFSMYDPNTTSAWLRSRLSILSKPYRSVWQQVEAHCGGGFGVPVKVLGEPHHRRWKDRKPGLQALEVYSNRVRQQAQYERLTCMAYAEMLRLKLGPDDDGNTSCRFLGSTASELSVYVHMLAVYCFER